MSPLKGKMRLSEYELKSKIAIIAMQKKNKALKFDCFNEDVINRIKDRENDCFKQIKKGVSQRVVIESFERWFWNQDRDFMKIQNETDTRVIKKMEA